MNFLRIESNNPSLPMTPNPDQIPLFKGLSPEKVIDMLALLPQKTIKRGRILYFYLERGNKFYFILKGYVSLFTYNQNHKKTIFAVLGPGESIGESILFNHPYQEYAQVVSAHATLAPCYQDQWKQWKKVSPHLQHNLSEVLNSRIHFLKKRMIQGKELTLTRLLAYLKSEILARGIQMGPEIWVPRTLTQEDIASFIDSTRQTVTLLLTDLKRQNIVNYNRDYFIFKPSFLNRVAGL